MRSKLTTTIELLIIALLVLTFILVPLIFSPLTTEFFEMPKLFFLVGSTLILLLLWTIKWVVDGKVTITRTPLDLPILMLAVVVILSTYFSDSKYISLYGNIPRVHGSAVSLIAYILLYFISVSNLRTKKQINILLLSFLVSSTIVALITLLSYFGVYPLTFASMPQASNFTPTGSSFATSGLLLLLLPILLISLYTKEPKLPLWISLPISTLLAVTLSLIGNWAILLLTLLIFGAVAFVNRDNSPNFIKLLPPLGIALLVFILGFLSIPNLQNPLVQRRIEFPREIQLPFITSWKISASTFRDYPILGSGPSTYLYDFTAFKPAEHNASRFWNVRFDTAYNEFLQVWATLGVLGFLSLTFLCFTVVNFIRRRFLKEEDPLFTALSISSFVGVLFLLLHPSTLTTLVTTFGLFATLLASQKSTGKIEELTLRIKTSRISDSNLVIGDILPILVFIPTLLLVIFGLWQLREVALADYHHRLALNSATTRAVDTYEHLRNAEVLNPYIDLYRIDLAQTNFAIANAIASQKGPSQSSPTGSLTDQDKQNIRQLLSQAITEGRAATTLNPRSAQNWEVLALIYRQISGVAENALNFSLDSYGRAIERDPRNPLLRLSVGGVYFSNKNYDLAIRFFTDAVNLKPDFANAYYNLAVALRDRGDLLQAQVVAEKVVSLLDPNSPDYKTAANLLSELKSATAASETVPPAAKETEALQNKELPNVLDLPKPAQIATPSAVSSPKPGGQ